MSQFSSLVALAAILGCFAFAEAGSKNETYCDGKGWVPFKDEKCFKLIRKWATREDAEELCEQEELESDFYTPTLAMTKTESEQKFLAKYLFETSSVQMNVWLGAKRPSGSSQFYWDDGSQVEFSDWAATPSSESLRQCVEMQSQYTRKGPVEIIAAFNQLRSSRQDGKWRNVICTMANYVACEKLQIWSKGKLQKSLLNSRSNHAKRIVDLESELSTTVSRLNSTRTELSQTKTSLSSTIEELSQTKSTLNSTKNNLDALVLSNSPVPVGFIYVQLPHASAPRDLWPYLSWTDVSSTYAGVFFRVYGGNSDSFGSIQGDASPRLSHVTTTTSSYCSSSSSVSAGSWSSYVATGYWAGSGYTSKCMDFLLSNSEVRPRNMAVRIWKRYA